MNTAVNPLRAIVFLVMLAGLGCRAQTATKTATPTPTQATSGSALSPEEARRVEVLIRDKSNVPPQYEIAIGPATKSEVPGYDQIAVTFAADGKTSKPMNFLLSTDGKTLAQFNKFDISQNPKDSISAAGRPARGGPANAPVVIVGYDDLECPFCAKMNAQLFPALLERYKDQVRIVYRDFPLDIHPWALRAAVDVNCVAAQSAPGYWALVDYIHAHADEIGVPAAPAAKPGTPEAKPQKTLARADDQLDQFARDEGKKQNLNAEQLNACLTKQDQTAVNASVKQAEGLGIEATPALFINGEKLEGAVPIEYVYRMIDGALVAAGQKPPAPVAVPAAAPAPAQAPATAKPAGD